MRLAEPHGQESNEQLYQARAGDTGTSSPSHLQPGCPQPQAQGRTRSSCPGFLGPPRRVWIVTRGVSSMLRGAAQ